MYIKDKYTVIEKKKIPKTIEIMIDNKGYKFSIYESMNVPGRCVALCNMVGTESYYGEGYDWFTAVSECMIKILHK
jgi:hypothetical protein